MFKSVGLFMIVIICVVAGSWFVNLNKLTKCDFEAPYKCEFIHGVGIVPVISIATAWFNINEEKIEDES